MSNHLSLLYTMDVAADVARLDPDYSSADDQILFRKLQKQRLPGLSPEQFQTLYAEWQERYAAKCARDRINAIGHLTRYMDERAKKNSPAPPFKCPCGAETNDPLNPAFMAIHQPHCEAAAQPRRRDP